MIKANELRIGNRIDVGDGYDAEVFEIGQDKAEISYDGPSNGFSWFAFDKINPIPLTEEWLERMGLEKDQIHNCYIILEFESGPSALEYFDGLIHLVGHNSGEGLHHIQYVHQLQNLYFALTGNELQISP